MKLTVGMSSYDDYDGTYFSIQALRMYQDCRDVDFLVIDNFGCEYTRDFVEKWARGRYIHYNGVVGTSAPRDMVFHEAQSEAVLCIDCHVYLAPGALGRLKRYYDSHQDSRDLLQGPLLHDDLVGTSTHFDPVWNDHMWGTWGNDQRGNDPNGEPFEIPMQGLGVFSCRKDAWLGFNQKFRGFGGEEGYIHEKYRQAGAKTLCLPWLRWMHRFGRPYGPAFPLNLDDRIRNYLIGHDELKLDLSPVFEHFSKYTSMDKIGSLAVEVLGQRDYSHFMRKKQSA